MGVKQYNLGKEHGKQGLPYMHHRVNRYDSRHGQRSYDNGYQAGSKERRDANQR